MWILSVLDSDKNITILNIENSRYIAYNYFVLLE